MESTLLTSQQAKLLTSFSANIDPELVENHFLIAQQLYVQPILGTALYQDICTRYDNQTLTGDTKTLYEDYIVPALAYSAWFSSAPFLHMRTQRSGINTQANPDATPVTVEELSIYVARVENLKNFYCERLNQYLIDNVTKFPLFRSDSTPVETNKGGGLYLGFSKSSTCRNKNNWWE